MKKLLASFGKLLARVGAILAARVLGVITIAALASLAVGVAMKTDVATALIVLGSLVLADLVLDDVLPRRGPA